VILFVWLIKDEKSPKVPKKKTGTPGPSFKPNETTAFSPSPPSDGGEGRGEEAHHEFKIPLSSILSPLVPRGERKKQLRF